MADRHVEQTWSVRTPNNCGPQAAIAIDRYIATPGQARAYQIGLSTILELKCKAKTAFGARFDPREFHRQILDSGSLPLPVLRAKLNRWIERGIGSARA